MTFNKEEKRYISAVLSQGKWDWFWYELSAMVPCMIIIVIGVINDSVETFGSGLIVYFLYRFWMIYNQSKKFPLVIDIFQKLDLMEESNAEQE